MIVTVELAAKKNAELGFPALVGSERQIAWAEQIRYNLWVDKERRTKENELAYSQARKEHGEEAEKQIERMEELFEKKCDKIFSQTSASAWIERRYELPRILIGMHHSIARGLGVKPYGYNVL